MLGFDVAAQAREKHEERRALEEWVRRRFTVASSDPMEAIIGAVGRLTAAGMSRADALDTVIRIAEETRKER